jgi:hypothetical protein
VSVGSACQRPVRIYSAAVKPPARSLIVIKPIDRGESTPTRACGAVRHSQDRARTRLALLGDGLGAGVLDERLSWMDAAFWAPYQAGLLAPVLASAVVRACTAGRRRP